MSKKNDEEKSERDKPATKNTMNVVKSKAAPPSASKAPSLAKKSSPTQHSNTATGGSEEYIKNKSSFKIDDDTRGAKTADDTPSLDKHGGWLHPLEDKADVVERKPKNPMLHRTGNLMTKDRFAREFGDLNDYIDDDHVEDDSLEEDERLIPICKFRGHAFCKLHRATRTSAPKPARIRRRSVSPKFHNDDRKNDFCQQPFRFNNCTSCCMCCPFRLRPPIVVDDFINFYDRRRVQDDICRLAFDRRGCDYPCCGYSIPFEPYRPRNCARPAKGRKCELGKNHSSLDDIDPLATCLVNRTSKLFKEAVKEWDNQEDDENDVGFDRSMGTDEKVGRRPTDGILKKNRRRRY